MGIDNLDKVVIIIHFSEVCLTRLKLLVLIRVLSLMAGFSVYPLKEVEVIIRF